MIRKCVVCGKKMKITVDKRGNYDVGHYFGVMKVPVGKGVWKRVGQTRFCGKSFGVVKWTGKKKNVEYGECNSCFGEVLQAK